MKPAGVVRRVDPLGRIVLPKSLRKRYRMNEGDAVEIFVSGDQIILEKYRPRCIFCGQSEKIIEYREKHLCESCLAEMSHML